MTLKVLVYAEVRNGKLKSTAAELLTLARRVTGDDVTRVHAVILGSGGSEHAATLARYGASKVLVVSSPETDTYQGEPHVQALSQIIKNGGYNVVMGPASPTGRDFFPRLACRHRAGLLTDVVQVRTEGDTVIATRPMYAGKALAEVASRTPLTFVTLRPNVLAAQVKDANASPAVENVTPSIDKASLKARIVEVRKGKSEKPDLTEASVIITGGRALGNSENFKLLNECADVIGATVGASRAAVDSGYAPHDMQVGQTGKTVNPNLYIACGVSGSIQHLAGMRTSKVIVAINTDADAPIFQKADYGIVADLFKAVPVLTQELKKVVEH